MMPVDNSNHVNGSQPEPSPAPEPTKVKEEYPYGSSERVTALLEGKIQPSNQFSAYLLQKLKEAAARGQQVSQRLSELRAEVKMLEDEGRRFEGAANSYLGDLRQWDGRAIPTEDPPPDNRG